MRSTQVLSWLSARRPVDLFALTGSVTGDQTAALDALGVRVLGAGDVDAIRRYLERHGPAVDLIVMAWSRVATVLMPAARAFAPRARIVFDTLDVNHVREFRHARMIGSGPLLRRALAIKNNEVAAIRAADRTIAITDVDRATFLTLVPDARVDTVGIWVAPEPPPPPRSDPRILYVGHYQTVANIDAAERLAQEILPAVRRVVPDARVELAGSDPPAAVLALASRDVDVPGWQDDLSARYRLASVFAAPMRIGSGLKGKLLRAMVHRLPIVATAIAVEGTGLVAERDYLPAETVGEFADAIAGLLTNPARGRAISEAAARVASERFSQAEVERQMEVAFGDYLTE